MPRQQRLIGESLHVTREARARSGHGVLPPARSACSLCRPPRQAFLRAGCLDSDPIRPAGIEESPGAIGSSCGAIGV
jgi:hypothetical protein